MYLFNCLSPLLTVLSNHVGVRGNCPHSYKNVYCLHPRKWYLHVCTVRIKIFVKLLAQYDLLNHTFCEKTRLQIEDKKLKDRSRFTSTSLTGLSSFTFYLDGSGSPSEIVLLIYSQCIWWFWRKLTCNFAKQGQCLFYEINCAMSRGDASVHSVMFQVLFYKKKLFCNKMI